MKLRETQADLLKRCFGKLLYEDFKKIEDSMNQDFRKSLLSNEDLGSERDTLLEPTFTSPDRRINFRQWNQNAEELRQELVNA